MAEAPTYQQMNEQRRNAELMKQQQMQKMEAAQQGLGSPNKMLQRYMSQGQGLGPVGPTSKGQEILESVLNGQMNPMVALESPEVSDNDKRVLMSLLQGGPQNEQAPEGLVPVR